MLLRIKKLKKKISGIIICSNSEFDSFQFLLTNKPELFNHSIFIFDRRSHSNLKELKISKKYKILNFKSSHDWFNFVLSAKRHGRKILNNFELKEIYFFLHYDPLVSILKSNFPELKLTSILNHPMLELNPPNKDTKSKIKGFIKNNFLALFIKIRTKIGYLYGCHFIEILGSDTNIIRMFPSKKENIFNFGKIITDLKDQKNLVFINGCIYRWESVNFREFLNDTLDIIEKYNINYFCFHPRDTDDFKNIIKKKFPHLIYHDFYSETNYEKDHLIFTHSSTTCFNHLIRGGNAGFIPSLYPSTQSELYVKIFMKYLKSVA